MIDTFDELVEVCIRPRTESGKRMTKKRSFFFKRSAICNDILVVRFDERDKRRNVIFVLLHCRGFDCFTMVFDAN